MINIKQTICRLRTGHVMRHVFTANSHDGSEATIIRECACGVTRERTYSTAMASDLPDNVIPMERVS